MDIMELGAIGELVGGVAVLVTLVYLALQVRQSQRQMTVVAEQIRNEASAATTDAMGSWLADNNATARDIARDAELSDILRRGLTDFEGLAGNEQMRFHCWMAAQILSAQNLYLAAREGTMHPRLSDRVMRFDARMLKSVGGRQWWARGRSVWDPTFISHMNVLMDDVVPIADDWPWFLATSD